MSNTSWVAVQEEIRQRNPDLLARMNKKEAAQVAFESGRREIRCNEERERAVENVAMLTLLIRDAYNHYWWAKQRVADDCEQNQQKEECRRQTNLECLAENWHRDKKKHAQNGANQLPPVEKTLTTKMPPASAPTEPVYIRQAQSDPETTGRGSALVSDPGPSHISLPVGVGRTSSYITIEKCPGLTLNVPMSELHSEDELDILADFCIHFLPDSEPMYRDADCSC